MDKYTHIVQIADYRIEDLKKVINEVTNMSCLYWSKCIQQAIDKIADEFLEMLGKQSPEDLHAWVRDYMGWAVFIGVCLASQDIVTHDQHKEGTEC